MVHAELKKLWSGAAFRFFFCLLLAVGILLPVVRTREPDPVRAVYSAYAGMEPQAVIDAIDARLCALELRQELENLAYIPPEAAEIFIQDITGRYGLSLEELEKQAGEGELQFSQDIYTEMELLSTVRGHAARSVEYGAYLDLIGRQAETIRSSSLYRDDPYARKLALRTAECYAHLAMERLPLTDPTGVENALGNWMDDAVACAIAALTALFLYCEERQSGMMPLLFSTPRGRRATYRAKTVLIVTISLCACLLLAAVRALCAGDPGDLSRPVQTIPAFYTAPYAISVGALLGLSFLQRSLTVVATGLFVGLLCILLDRALAIGTAALTAGASVLCWTMIDASSWCQVLKYLSAGAMLSDETLWGSAVFVKLGQLPVPFGIVYATVVCIGGIAVYLAGGRLFCKAHLALSIPSRNRRLREKKRNPGLLSMELRKLLIHQRAAVVLLLLLVLQPGIYDTYRSNFTIDELRYLSKMATVQGPYSGSAHDALIQELTELEARQLQAEPILADELGIRINTLQRVIRVSEYLLGREEQVSYVYETGHLALLGKRPIGFSGQQLLGMAALSLLLPGLFTLDPEIGTDRLLSTTAGRKALRRRKRGIALALGLTVFLICWLPAAHFILDTFELSMWTAPAVSIQSLSRLPGWIPLWLASLGVWLGRLAGLLGFSALVCAAAGRIRRYLPTVLLGLALTAASAFL